MTATRWTTVYAVIVAVMLAILAGLVLAVPAGEDGLEWTKPMIAGGWMAWTFPVALFFFCIASLLILFTLLAIRFPETPRRGVLHIETTRGDRLFITLLGSAFINLGWLYFFGAPLTGALILCPIYAIAVFRWV
jgi:predicted small integral membrane protein